MKRPHPFHDDKYGDRRRAGFTLVEMIVAMAVIASAMVVVVQAMARVQDTWSATNAKVREATDARAGFEALMRTIPRAVLNPRWVTDSNEESPSLLRDSDLHFVCGPATDLITSTTLTVGHAIFFQAPSGLYATDDRTTTSSSKAEYDTLPNMLNAWGYFVEFGEDPVQEPSFLSNSSLGLTQSSRRYRFRLMEFRQPAHELELFAMNTNDDQSSQLSTAADQHSLYEWFNEPLRETDTSGKRRCAVAAENILALIILPVNPGDTASLYTSGGSSTSSATEYLYDSRQFQWNTADVHSEERRHRLPLAVQLSLIVLDERDWSKLTDDEASQAGAELRGLVTPKFESPENFSSDMGSITGELNRRKMRHRVITTTLQIPAGMGAPEEEAGQQ